MRRKTNRWSFLGRISDALSKKRRSRQKVLSRSSEKMCLFNQDLMTSTSSSTSLNKGRSFPRCLRYHSNSKLWRLNGSLINLTTSTSNWRIGTSRSEEAETTECSKRLRTRPSMTMKLMTHLLQVITRQQTHTELAPRETTLNSRTHSWTKLWWTDIKLFKTSRCTVKTKDSRRTCTSLIVSVSVPSTKITCPVSCPTKIQ